MTRAAWREGAGWAAALALSIVVVGQVASTARSQLLFRDADSLVVALLSCSIAEGDRLDWALSSVLFLPETALLLLLRAALPALSVAGLLAVNAVLNLLALYGALRLAAGRRDEGRSPVAWSLVAHGTFGVLAVTETSASREALEPASLLLTTTYYSATVVGTVLAVGLVRRHLDRPRVALPTALGIVSLASTMTNPLFLVWAVAPLVVLLAVAAIPRLLGHAALLPLAVLVGGALLGLAARMPFSAWIANSGVGYARPDRWVGAAEYYGQLAMARLATPGGLIAVTLMTALIALCVLRSIRIPVERGARLVAAFGWFTPLAVVAGVIALGTNASRYLEPIAFGPVLGLLALPSVRRPLPHALTRLVTAVAAVLLLAGTVLSIPRIQAAATAPDADAACVRDWVDASDRTGGGQFWTVRLPKLMLEDAARLVQVDHTLRGYAWLVNRSDFAAERVTFLVEDLQSAPWDITGQPVPDSIVECGRYRILDYSSHPLPIGPQRS
ncbi:hypothetical protein [Microbacterium sp.]|uniref:hypothetical protein n=1 Tax=Microbacterium sp. TaxID=51671 RepID=UPI0028122A35|nr:hypothetical protein [Microbacterium sp.]